MTKCTKFIILLIILILSSELTACSAVDRNNINDNSDSIDTEIIIKDDIYTEDEFYGDESMDDTDIIITKKTLEGIKIVLDPGHGKYNENFKEPVSPGSNEMKPAFSTGTQGAYLSEAEFNLIIAQKLKPILEAQGASVYMTRTDENSVSNVERAEFANELNADLAVRIHADGSTDTSMLGISMLVPATGTIGSELETISCEFGKVILDSLITATGASNRGIIERDDLTGFNWSSVPVILIECGFMSNPDEDALLSNESYQDMIAEGIAQGIVIYYENN